jgi:4-hydroxy-tetrahydrodipicolinate synthase
VGADAVLLVNPYYNKPTQKGLYLHFKAIAESVDIPCILYNIKGRTGVNIETETVKALSDACSNIVGVKEASGSLEQMRAVIDATHGKFHVLSGDDNLSLALIESGGERCHQCRIEHLPSLYLKNDSPCPGRQVCCSAEMEATLAGFFKACFLETNPIPIKTAMARYGWCEESFRLPLCSFENEEKQGPPLCRT